MATMSELTQVPGAIAGFTFSQTGELIESDIKPGNHELDESTLGLLAHICVANMAISNMQATGWEKSSDLKGFHPVEGFTFVCVDVSVVSRGHQAIVLINHGADYDKAFRALAG
ncbi:hypothetical protein A9404_11395 [Halothiobacillus diazotrophicus]|uniref:Roadblock/LAMTOR2 domain-containing protein n=1 Tax=Halothiobacillus diazotrophicus TaxID=1860122 RepID=A0A191ZJ55_9GAMM|nr:DUF2173 family protein [Halothiobacillus diazotrophicus]ANJ67900.1 hypothetical protein A9404_11395 [Halothiobacillus diazotrophicus]